MAVDRTRMLRGALAGAGAAVVWAAQQPLDKRVFGCAYDDVELLGRVVAPDGGASEWYPVGLALHVQNGAVFGALYAVVAPGLPLPAALRGPAAGLLEHLIGWPFVRLTDRWHPARAVLPGLTGNRRAFWQAAWRHALFGFALGELERRLNPPAPPASETAASDEEYVEAYVSSNGRGDIARAAVGRDDAD